MKLTAANEKREVRRVSRKQRLIQRLGGSCVFCGYDDCPDALEFHHYTGRKNFTLSKPNMMLKWERVLAEAELCVLLCNRCHRELHGGYRSLHDLDESVLKSRNIDPELAYTG